MNYYSDSPEWKYLFNHAVEWDEIIPLYFPSFPTSSGFKSKEELIRFFEQLLETTGKWAGETLRERAKTLDETGCATLNANGSVSLTEPMLKTYEEARGLEIFGTTMRESHGGMGLPLSVGMFAFEQIARACVSTSTQLGFFTSMADMLERFADEETKNRLIPKIIRGETSGSMCLTEPDAGSDVGALRTSATPMPDGTYLLNGTKCFITNAGGGFGLILARIDGAPAGLSGISLFLAEEKHEGRQNYRITKIEEKMGMHGSMTCEVVYENTHARLVGEAHGGFRIMLHLMNEARISVGLQSIGGIEAALERARSYAEVRTQFGKPISTLPLFKRNLEDWFTEQDAFRAFMADTISSFDIFQHLDLKSRRGEILSEHESRLFKKHQEIVRARTPLVKYTGAETYAILSTKAIQAFGGYGYMKEYEVERIHRDCFGALLYEGTSQIQSLMALKDHIKKVMKNPGRFVQSMVGTHPIGTLIEKNEFKKTYLQLQHEFQRNLATLILNCFSPGSGLLEKLTHLNDYFHREFWTDMEKLERMMTHSETLCQALSHLEIIKVLGKQAARDAQRRELFERYLLLVKPRLASIYKDWELRA
ncbi:MAG: acyl-CoA dehydrogenase family protein [Bdellovibrionales bacterium]|nr:acyl-CoA dehydrogenase family protein [Bdellovibrionales bacterium]